METVDRRMHIDSATPGQKNRAIGSRCATTWPAEDFPNDWQLSGHLNKHGRKRQNYRVPELQSLSRFWKQLTLILDLASTQRGASVEAVVRKRSGGIGRLIVACPGLAERAGVRADFTIQLTTGRLQRWMMVWQGFIPPPQPSGQSYKRLEHWKLTFFPFVRRPRLRGSMT